MTQHAEFQHLIPAARIGPEPFKTNFVANARALDLLAKRYGIVAVDSFEGEATLRREANGMTIAVTGSFTARVTQACVTTLEPVNDQIAETFEGWFLDESQAASFTRAQKRRAALSDDAIDAAPFGEDENPVTDEQDEPEPVVAGMVDVGELAAQHLSLALNPYPHSAGALEAGPLGEEKNPEKTSPFAVLGALKGKEG